MNLLKLARETAIRIKQASVQNYKALLNANEQAQAASIDPYDDASPEEKDKLKEIAKRMAILANKAYQQGLPGTELHYIMQKVKNTAISLYSSSKSSAVKKDLGAFLEAANKVQYIDIPSQMAGSTAEVKPKNSPVTTETSSGAPDQTQQMLDLAKGLADKDPYRNLSNQPAGSMWETPGDPAQKPF